MKFNHQEMINHFGKIYRYHHDVNAAYVDEEFNIGFNNNFHTESQLDLALVQLKDVLETNRISEIKRLEDMKTEFRNLSFFQKLDWQMNNKKFNFDSTSEDRKKIVNEQYKNKLEKIHVKYIDTNKTYTINTPKILVNGDILFVAITDHNTLDIGIYQATVISTDYFARDYNNSSTIDFRGILSIMENDKEHTFTFKTNEEQFISSYAYHNIFTNKEKAIEFHNQNIQTKLKEMEEKIINIDSTFISKNKP